MEAGVQHPARAKQRGWIVKCAKNAVSERSGETPNSADPPPRCKMESTLLQNGSPIPDSSWLGRREILHKE